MPLLIFATFNVFAQTQQSVATKSEYAGQEAKKVKALSNEEIAGFLGGKGLGFAKSAELNNFPGPMHVLALSDKLALTSEQKRKIQSSRFAPRPVLQRLRSFFGYWWSRRPCSTLCDDSEGLAILNCPAIRKMPIFQSVTN
jgi:hypothetical protein